MGVWVGELSCWGSCQGDLTEYPNFPFAVLSSFSSSLPSTSVVPSRVFICPPTPTFCQRAKAPSMKKKKKLRERERERKREKERENVVGESRLHSNGQHKTNKTTSVITSPHLFIPSVTLSVSLLHASCLCLSVSVSLSLSLSQTIFYTRRNLRDRLNNVLLTKKVVIFKAVIFQSNLFSESLFSFKG